MIMQSIADLSGILQHPQFPTTLEAVAQKAREALPLANGRIEKAVTIVLSGGVTLLPDGHAVVASQSRPHTQHHVNGTCGCPDGTVAPGQWCKHRIAAGLFKRTQEALARVPAPVTDLPPIEAPTPVEIDARFITYLHGKAFVRYAGLLAKAHAAGLVKLDARIEFHSDALVLASVTATFQDGRVFTEWADAMPDNVGAQVRPHWIRMALTRAKARCLRDALNIGMCSVEEVSD
jgi:hypothetical protein